MSNEYQVIPTKREVIEHKLLTALQEDGVVACLFSKQDLQDLLYVLKDNPPHWAPEFRNRIGNLHEGIKQLLNEIA